MDDSQKAFRLVIKNQQLNTSVAKPEGGGRGGRLRQDARLQLAV